MGARSLHALLTVNREAIVCCNQIYKICFLRIVALNVFGSHWTSVPCYALRGSALLCQGSGVSGPGREHPEKWPNKHLSAEEGLQEDGMGLQRDLF